MTNSKTYIFGEQGNSFLNALLPFLQQRGIDPAGESVAFLRAN